jgi:hypothetical protein
MSIEDFESAAMNDLAERNAGCTFMLLSADGEYLGYVDPYRGEADKA